jgi:hypothetical protein
VSSAVWGFIGVITGAVLTTAKDVVVENIRGNRERDRHAESLAREVRTARRLIADEVDTLARNFETLIRLKRTPKQPLSAMPHFLPVDEWERQNNVLARVVDDDTWSELVALYHNTRSLRARLTIDPLETPLKKEDLDRLVEMASDTKTLQKTLAEPLEKAVPAT